MRGRLPRRDNANGAPVYGVRNRQNPSLRVHTEGQIPLSPGVLIGQRNRAVIIERDHGVDELNPVLAEIAFGFFRVPFLFHLLSLLFVYSVHRAVTTNNQRADDWQGLILERVSVNRPHTCVRSMERGPLDMAQLRWRRLEGDGSSSATKRSRPVSKAEFSCPDSRMGALARTACGISADRVEKPVACCTTAEAARLDRQGLGEPRGGVPKTSSKRAQRSVLHGPCLTLPKSQFRYIFSPRKITLPTSNRSISIGSTSSEIPGPVTTKPRLRPTSIRFAASP